MTAPAKSQQIQSKERHRGDLKRIFTGAGISGIGKVVNGISQFAFYIVLGRALGTDATGAYFVGFAVFQLALQLSLLSQDNVARRFVPLLTNARPLFVTLVRIVLVAGLLVFAALAAFVLLPETPPIKGAPAWLLLAFAASATMGALVNVDVGFFHGMKNVLPAALVWEVIYPVQRLVLTVVFLNLGYGLFGAVAAFGISAGTAALLGNWWVSRYIAAWLPSIDKPAPVPPLKEILSYAAPMMAARVLGISLVAGLPLLLGNFATPTDVALLGTAFRVILLAQLAVAAVNSVFAPTLSEYMGESRLALQNLYRMVSEILLLTVGVSLVIAILFAEQIMAIFGSAFSSGANHLRLLACGQLFVLVFGACDQLLYMAGKSRQMLTASILGTSLGVATALIGYPLLGTPSFAIGLVAGMCITQLSAYYFCIAEIHIRPVGRKQILIGGGMAGVATLGFVDVGGLPRLFALGVLISMLAGFVLQRLRSTSIAQDHTARNPT